MEPIHVLVLDTVMDRGGAESMIMNYMRNIDRDIIKFDFMVNREYKAAFEDEIESLGGTIYRMCPMYPQYFSRYKKEFKKFLTTHPEYKIIHSNLEERSYLPLKVAKKMGVPIRISHSHNVPKGFNLKSIIREYFKFMLKYYNTDLFACGKQAGQWLYGKKNSNKIVIMNNAIDAQKYSYDEQLSNKIKEQLGLQDKYVVGHVGRFFAQKNHTFLIDIFNELHKNVKNAHLVLVGGGEEKDELKNQIKQKVHSLGLDDCVTFLGVREDVNVILQAFDIFLLPSLHEGLPVTMIEAQASGLPCVISDTVPKECDITGNVSIVSLTDNVSVWSDKICKIKDSFVRVDTYQKIKDNHFDIKENALWLQNYYVDRLNSKG